MTQKTRHDRLIGLLCVAGVLLCWAFSPIFIKLLSAYTDSYTQNFFRYSTAALFWLPYLIYQTCKGRVPAKVWLLAAIPTICNMAMQTCWARSLYYIDPGLASLSQRTVIFWTIIMTVIFYPDERGFLRRKALWCGVVMVLLGVYGVVSNQEGFGRRFNPLGIFFVLCNSISWSLYTIAIRKYLQKVDPVVCFAMISIYTSLGLGAMAFSLGDPMACVDFSAKVWFYMIFSGFIAIAIAHVLYISAVQRLGTTLPVIIMSFLPFVVLLGSHIVFNENLNLWQYLSGIIIIAGSIISVLVQGQEARKNHS